MTPQQQQAFQMSQYLNKSTGGANAPLSYEQWLAARGGGNPYAPVPQQQQASSPDVGSLIDKIAAGKGVESAVSSAVSGAAPTISQATAMGNLGAPGLSELGIANAGDVSGLSGLSSLSAPTAPGIMDLGGIGGAGNVILPAAGAIGAYDVLSHNYGPGRGGLEGAASGAAIGSYFGPTGALVGGGIGGLVGLGKGLFKHETTRQHAQKDTAAMRAAFPDDATYQAYVNGMRQQYDSAPPDPSKPFHNGQYGSWSEYQKAGLDAKDLTGVKGNIDTFGADWAHLSQDQRQAVTQKLIDANLYNSKRGEVEVTDANKAKQIYADMAKGGFKIPVATAAPVTAMPSVSAVTGTQQTMIPRTQTRSPGIGLNGQRIKY